MSLKSSHCVRRLGRGQREAKPLSAGDKAAASRDSEFAALETSLQERLDPIDWATYEAYLWRNEATCYRRCSVLFGALFQLNWLHGQVHNFYRLSCLDLIGFLRPRIDPPDWLFPKHKIWIRPSVIPCIYGRSSVLSPEVAIGMISRMFSVRQRFAEVDSATSGALEQPVDLDYLFHIHISFTVWSRLLGLILSATKAISVAGTHMVVASQVMSEPKRSAVPCTDPCMQQIHNNAHG